MAPRSPEKHRAAFAQKMGRAPKPGHDIDHLNEDHADNAPGNLQEVPHGAHSSRTGTAGRRSLRALTRSLQMVRKGIKQY